MEEKEQETIEDVTIIEKFDPKMAELVALVESTKNITATDLEDKGQLELVKKTRISLRNSRTNIEKTGLAIRGDANKFIKNVIEYEKKLIAVISPEEKRLKEIEEEAEKLAVIKARELMLPLRKERLAAIGDDVEVSDSIINQFDNVEFDTYVNTRVSEKNRKDAEALEQKAREEDERIAKEKAEAEAELKAREDKIKEDERKLEQEKEAREREERARIEEREKIEREQAEKEAREKKEAEQKAAAEAKQKEEDERIAKEKAKAEALEKIKQEEAKNQRLAEMPDNVRLQLFIDREFTELYKICEEMHLSSDNGKSIRSNIINLLDSIRSLVYNKPNPN